jgi:transcriptional regulator with XRE-family HTH domain
MTPFRHARFVVGGLTPADAAARLGTTERTVRRWERGDSTPPAGALLALHLLGGDLGSIHPAWTGYRLDPRTGYLHAPNGDGFAPGEVQAIPLQVQRVAALERRLRELENRPEPSGAPADVVQLRPLGW